MHIQSLQLTYVFSNKVTIVERIFIYAKINISPIVTIRIFFLFKQ